MAALSAVPCNPAVRAVYARLVAKHPQQKAIAIGHGMRKLVHRVFAIWQSGQTFNRNHDPWQGTPAEPSDNDLSINDGPSGNNALEEGQAAGHRPDAKPARQVVTAACTASVAGGGGIGQDAYLDFAHVKKQLSRARVLDPLGLSDRLRGRGAQRRCACPLHRGDARGRKGDVIDLWAAVHGYGLREAALDLVRTFGLEPAPHTGTEKRHGEARLRVPKLEIGSTPDRPGCAPPRRAKPYLPPVITETGL